MDNKTLNLFRYSLRQVEAEIARLTEKAGDYREIIKREETKRIITPRPGRARVRRRRQDDDLQG